VKSDVYKNRNNCQTGSFGQVFVVTFARRLKFAQTYRAVYGHSPSYCASTTGRCVNLFNRAWGPLVRIPFGWSMGYQFSTSRSHLRGSIKNFGEFVR
jgi:hypothetical protein